MNQAVLYITEAVSKYIVQPSQTQLLEMISAYDTVEHANENLSCLTGIRDFFPNKQALEEFRRVISRPVSEEDKRNNREWGDFQTPSGLAVQVCKYLAEIGVSPKIIIEPTYGTGNFIRAALKSFAETELVYGVEIQKKYEWHLKVALLLDALLGHRVTAKIELHQDDIFTHCFPAHILKAKDVLIVGNPPWVTIAELSALNASNLPAKGNVKALKGMDAMTGKSNFDISEFVLLRMLDLFSEQRGRLAMLCKNAVIKNVVEILPKRQFSVSNLRAFQIDAGREFNVGVEASLLVMDMGVTNSAFTCQVATLDKPNCETRRFGWLDEKFVSDIEGYQSISGLDGKSPLVWRQGLKHDCARIMELNTQDGLLVNGNKEVVDVENEQMYWLLKSSDLRSLEVKQARKKVIVTQQRLGGDTSNLQKDAPKLWEYLVRNSEYFDRRKSRIYRGKSRFSIFGIGEYAFKKYKVAISGLYKEPWFSLVPPIENRPVMLDDTCYFLGFDSYPDALFTASLLNSPTTKQFIKSIVFADAKRPYTKAALMRIDLAQAASRFSFDNLRNFWAEIKFESSISLTQFDFEEYKNRLAAISENREDLQLSFA